MQSEKAGHAQHLMVNLENVIWLGDCLIHLSKLEDNSIDFLFTDPPFFTLNKPNIKFKQRADMVRNAEFDNFESEANYLAFLRDWVNVIAPKMGKNSNGLIFIAIQYYSDLLRAFQSFGFKHRGHVIWRKLNPPPQVRQKWWVSSSEVMLCISRGKSIFNWLGQRDMLNVLDFPICGGNERLKSRIPDEKGKFPSLHPTQKPEDLCRFLIRVLSNKGQILCDPFAGVGSINASAYLEGRICYGMELQEEFYSAATERLRVLRERNPGIQHEITKWF